MKKITALLLSLTMIASFSACGEKEEETTSTAETTTVTTKATTKATPKETVPETTENLNNYTVLDKECLFNDISFKFSSEWAQTFNNTSCIFIKNKNILAIQMGEKTLDDETEFEIFFETYLNSETVTDVFDYNYTYIDGNKVAYVDCVIDNRIVKNILLINGNKKYTFLIPLLEPDNTTSSDFGLYHIDFINSIKFLEPNIEDTLIQSEEYAIETAKKYLEYNGMTPSDLYAQLILDGFETEYINHAVDNCKADWNQEAADKAKYYIEFTGLSSQELYEQLIKDGFTEEQAEYGVTAVGY